jgi:alcohol dehydrogenase (NADP+)
VTKAVGYATRGPKDALGPFTFERREPGPKDVRIEVLLSGVCHSDIHQARDEWGGSIYPMVPGHEIVGRVTQVGKAVTRFTVGDLAGVGCMVDSCRECESCRDGEEQYCDRGQTVFTYNGRFPDGTPTYGGYSDHIVVDEAFTLRISPKLDLATHASPWFYRWPCLRGRSLHSPCGRDGLELDQMVAVLTPPRRSLGSDEGIERKNSKAR